MMARIPSAALHTLWILFFSYATNEITATGHVQEFACVTDYAKELVCHWKVPTQTNCSKEFLLYYRKEFLSLRNHVCVPENGKESSTCTCTICSDYFVSGLTYILALQFNGTDMWNYSVTPALVVKPRAPKNLAIEKAENGNFNLSWEESYTPPSMLSGQPVIYEVKYWSKQDPTEVSIKSINYQTKSFEIIASSLRKGYDYVVCVRCNYTDYPAYWSDWSDRVEFHYDYQVTTEDILQMAVPVSCILIMAVAVICYFCFTKVKKEWWDQIPNPAKSHLVVKNVKFSVLCYIDEIKFPFHDLKQSRMENQISCKNCLAQSLSGQSFKGKDNISHIEKPCSCYSKSGDWFPKGNGAVLTPETILVEKSLEICECLTDIEAESQEETCDQVTMFEPCEGGASTFREHIEHNDALANMFMELLADENNTQGNEDRDVITDKNKTFEGLESENPLQQNPKENADQHQQPCGIFHTDSLFSEVSQDDYNCSTASKKSARSEESFESGYQSSNTNSASLEARGPPDMLDQSLSSCSSEIQHDSSVLIQESPKEPAFEIIKHRISNSAYKSIDSLVSSSLGPCSSAYKSFDTLVSPSVGPCSSAYKSFDTLVSPSVGPCSSAYKSFDTLVSPSKGPGGSACKSFDTLLSQSTANNSLTPCFENMCSSLPLTQFSENPELHCRDEIYQLPSDQRCYANYRSACTELDFQSTCSDHTDFPSFSTHANNRASAFLPEEEIYKQITYQNVQKKADVISCPIGPRPSGYQSFDTAVKCNGTYFDNDSEVICRSQYEPFLSLLYNNLREAPPDTIIREPDQKTDNHVCLILQGFDSGIVPGLATSENVSQNSDNRLWIINSNELSSDSNDENTIRDLQLLRLLEVNSQDFKSREKTIKGAKPDSFDCADKGMQESSSNRLNADFQCHTHTHLKKPGNTGENKEVIQHVVSRRWGSAGNLPEESLDRSGLSLKRKTADSLELPVIDKVAPPLSVDNSCPSYSCTIPNEGSKLTPLIKKRSAELLRENNRKNEKKVKLLQVLAQEDNCYMKACLK
ncbi:interleukin-4 receptor subunit alpha [Dromaius novaehollandiae]|uniref:Interleukin-4 receptor subunit alpha n=2 Tax=Dromaius novaehollandiae TaxID=8790 RepID=A0A8C4KQ26_DRONO|nr:interleukin-4 receptor subunit alpha [Dromaius novaehollandiae]XP_025969673.1 interleukin-4 receptor subunit alpha [Dromaius novaehollandiae]